MYTFSLRYVDDQESLVIEETKVVKSIKVVESMYVEQPVMRARHGCYPIGRCNCPNKNFDGWKFKTATIVGAEALIAVGIVAVPIDAYCVGEHIAVRYSVSSKVGMIWICTKQKPGVILAHAMHGIVKYCDTRLEKDIRKHVSSDTELLLMTPDVDLLGHALKTVPLKKLS